MTSLFERRCRSRHFGRGLLVLAPGGAHTVCDLSPDGLSLQGKPFALGDSVTIIITSLSDTTKRIEADCHVIAIGASVTHLAFTRVNMPLLTYVVQHIGTELGVAPYYFGKEPAFPAFA
jgi:hypothetical protein